jgi:hypothetical protein
MVDVRLGNFGTGKPARWRDRCEIVDAFQVALEVAMIDRVERAAS